MACSGDDSDATPDSGQGGEGGEGGESGTSGHSGGSGGMGGEGGEAGDGMTGEPDGGEPDTGTPGECDGVANPCTTAGVSCDGNTLVTCAEDADGCLVKTSDACDDYCDSAAKACASCDDLEDACEEGGATCDGDTLVLCATNADGCLVQTSFDCTDGDNEYCDADGEPPVCVDCADLDNACNDEGFSCDENTLVECAEDAHGCLVATETDCEDDGDNNVCDPEADPDPACSYDPCIDEDGELKDNVCVVDEATCSGNILVNCVDDSDGCAIATQTNCATDPGHNVCDDSLETPACAFNPCIGVSNCLEEGVTCDGADRVTCAENGNGCLVATTFDCTVNGTLPETCDLEAGPDFCTACQDDVGCGGAAVEGDTSCAANVFGTCSDTDGDTCLNLVTEACGDDFTCDAEDGCVYDGGDVCVETIPENRTLRTAGSYGPFTTVGQTMSEFGPFSTCPGQGFALQVVGADLLFALDVPPESVIEVDVVGATGFNSNTWLFLTSSCAANAETTCLGNGTTTIEYTNTTDTTTRVYLEFDSSTDFTNVGMFGLAVDTRPLGCGDGKRDGDEECDDANVFDDDGCSPTCELEEGFACTEAEPSVCTLRPDENVCGNVACPALTGTDNGVLPCCTPTAQCGVAYDFFFGSACIAREPVRPVVPPATCPAETGLFVAQLDGCCKANGKCGLRFDNAGCVERTAAWTAMDDGLAALLYGGGPFLSVNCTP